MRKIIFFSIFLIFVSSCVPIKVPTAKKSSRKSSLKFGGSAGGSQDHSPTYNVGSPDKDLPDEDGPAQDPDIFRTRISSVMEAKCIFCHKPNSGGASDFTKYKSDNDWANSPYVVPGSPSQSKLIYRLQNFLGATPDGTLKDMPTVDSFKLTNAEYLSWVEWVENIKVSDVPDADGDEPGEDPVEIYGGASLQIGDSLYVYKFLKNIFGDSIGPSLASNVIKQATFFGGGCDHNAGSKTALIEGYSFFVDIDEYEFPSLVCGAYTDPLASQLGTTTAARSGVTLQLCEEIVANDEAIAFAITKAKTFAASNLENFSINKNPTLKQIKSVFALFYPEKYFTGGLPSSDDFRVILNFLDSKDDFTPKDKWRTTFYAVCSSPEWQLY